MTRVDDGAGGKLVPSLAANDYIWCSVTVLANNVNGR